MAGPKGAGGSTASPSPLSKRVRSIMANSAGESSLGSGTGASNDSGAFSDSVKLKVKEQSGIECWACSSLDTDVCHVIPKEDTQVDLWSDRGLIQFSLRSPANGILLCPSCHRQFNRSIDPGFVFVPTDLKYFIDFEKEDRKRRNEAGESVLKRRVPSPEDYKIHQVKNGTIDSNATGGQYHRIFLRRYINTKFDPNAIDRFPKTGVWHGAPMASLRRSIHILGSGRLSRLSKQTVSELEELRNLYFFDDDNREDLSNNAAVPLRMQVENRGKKRELDEYTPQQPSPNKKRATEGETNRNVFYCGATEYCPVLQKEVPAYWSLGPEVSADEAVRRFGPLIVSSSQ